MNEWYVLLRFINEYKGVAMNIDRFERDFRILFTEAIKDNAAFVNTCHESNISMLIDQACEKADDSAKAVHEFVMISIKHALSAKEG